MIWFPRERQELRRGFNVTLWQRGISIVFFLSMGDWVGRWALDVWEGSIAVRGIWGHTYLDQRWKAHLFADNARSVEWRLC